MAQNHKVIKTGPILKVSHLINFSSNRKTSTLFSLRIILVRSNK